MRILGMISGTSHDGIDMAVVDFVETDGELVCTIEHTDSIPYPDELRAALIAALPPAAVSLQAVCELDTWLGQAFADAAHIALDAFATGRGADQVDAICSHGQTVFHWVDGGVARGTLQLAQPAWIAEEVGIPVLSDLRSADVAAGGQGAPLVSILDRLLLRPDLDAGRVAGALNLGGIANMTVWAPGRELAAWDIGPANALIDAAVTSSDEVVGAFDRDGRLAAAGTVDRVLLDVLLEEPYYGLPAPKSSGKELFHRSYVADAAARAGTAPRLVDLVATLTELTAVTVADAVRSAGLESLLVSGGGVRNPVMMARIRDLLPGTRIVDTGAVGVPADEKEAIAFALIGWATLHGLPGNVPSCTGASGGRVLGRLTPTADGRVPELSRAERWPESARFVLAGGER